MRKGYPSKLRRSAVGCASAGFAEDVKIPLAEARGASLEEVDPLYFHAFFLQKALQSLPLIERTAKADPAVRAEVSRNRDQFYSESILFSFFFSTNGMVGGCEEDDGVRHDQFLLRAMRSIASTALWISSKVLKQPRLNRTAPSGKVPMVL